MDEFAATDFDLPVDGNWSTGIVSYALASIAVGDARYAASLFDRLEPWADQWSTGGLSTLGPFTCFLGGLATVLGRYDDADRYFAQAAESTARMGAMFFAALTDQLWGQMLTERNAPGDLDRRATCSTAPRPSPRRTATRTSNDALQKHSNTWAERTHRSAVPVPGHVSICARVSARYGYQVDVFSLSSLAVV